MTQPQILTHNPLAAWTEIDGEIVVISPQDSVLHELNDTASFVWKQADGRRSAEAIAELLAGEYDVAAEQARADTEEFVAHLLAKKLLVAAGAEGEAEVD